jgi:hypothetical protein
MRGSIRKVIRRWLLANAGFGFRVLSSEFPVLSSELPDLWCYALS